jgi:signal peptidase I
MAATTVASGQLFVMGDNRPQSFDSRMFGTVDEDLVVGRAFVIIWPLGSFHWL